MRTRGILLAAALLSCAFAPAPFPNAKKSGPANLQALQGTWEIVGRQLAPAKGGPGTVRRSPVNRVRIQKDVWSYIAADAGGERVTVSYTLKLDPSKTPHLIDMERVGYKGTGKYVIRGLYTLKGDGLEILYRYGTGDVQRPESFATPPAGATLLTLKRMKR
jgi:uncharacterized protein (TIGR03067 family)